MGDLSKKTTHVAEGLDSLVEQFRRQPKILAFLTSFLNQIQDAENAAFELIDERTLATAVGVQLDGLGSIIGLARGGLTDDQYRLRLQAQILVNRSSGTIPQLLEIIALLDPGVLTLTESFPAAFIMQVLNITQAPATIAALIAAARAAGVRGILHYSNVPTGEGFKFSSSDAFGSGSSTGFANDAGTTGGHFADALEA